MRPNPLDFFAFINGRVVYAGLYDAAGYFIGTFAQKNNRVIFQSKNRGRSIVIALLLGACLGLSLKYVPVISDYRQALLPLFTTVGHLFISLIKMCVVPIVFVSLTVGSANLSAGESVGKIGALTLAYYLITTALAIALALVVAHFCQVGGHASPVAISAGQGYQANIAPSWLNQLQSLVPENVIKALAEGDLLQVIIFAVSFGLVVGAIKDKVPVLYQSLLQLNEVLMLLITRIMALAPIGVLCLIAALLAEQGVHLIVQLVGYFAVVLLVLALQGGVVYSSLLYGVARLNPLRFYKKMASTMLFAFSVSSSNATLPLTLKTVETRLGVSPSIASFVVPMGATLNMDGTAIMQGVATVLIANIYQVHLGLSAYLTVIGMATVASIGTAGVPSVGLITLAMVLRQVHLPVEAIALIIGVDRLLDMARTAINISGDAMVSCLVAHHLRRLDRAIFDRQEILK